MLGDAALDVSHFTYRPIKSLLHTINGTRKLLANSRQHLRDIGACANHLGARLFTGADRCLSDPFAESGRFAEQSTGEHAYSLLYAARAAFRCGLQGFSC